MKISRIPASQRCFFLKSSFIPIAAMSDKQHSSSTPPPPKGEIWVWFTSVGLTLGLVMVLVLFGLITIRGLNYFWPVRVLEIEVEKGSDSAYRGLTTFAGALDEKHRRTERVLADPKKDDDVEKEEDVGSLDRIPETYEEWKLFIGNRGRYGTSFRYFRVEDIEEKSYPDEIIRAERRAEGDALFYARRLRLDDGTVLEKGDAGFETTLRRVVDEARERRAERQRIDRHEIGSINVKQSDIDLELRYFRKLENPTEAQVNEIEQLEARKAELQEEFRELQKKSDELDRINSSIVLEFAHADGNRGEISMRDLYRYYYPNKLGLFERLEVFGIRVWEFVSGYPRDANMGGGIFPAIFGTLMMTLIMSIAVTPFGVIAAIYLREYARQGPVVRGVRIAVNNLAGVPSIVFGVFGLGFFVYLFGGAIDEIFFPREAEMGTPTFGTGGILWAGLTLALLNLPVVIVATEESISAVSRGVREGSLACGASKWQTVQRLIIPASLPGILTGMILAMARGAGEVAPLMLVGVVALAPNLPVDGNFPFIHLERKFMHLGFHIYDVGFQSPDSEAAIPTVFATTLVLIALILALNLSAILLRNHIRKKHVGSAF